MTRRGPVLEVGMKSIAIGGALLCLAAPPAAAAGLNFNWNTTKQCPTAAVPNWTFACDNNDTLMYMVVSFKPNVALSGFNALEAFINGQSWGPVPAWWQAFNVGSCREAAFVAGVIDVNPTAPCLGSTYTKLWTMQAYGGMGAWIYDMRSNRFRTVVGFATIGDRAQNLSLTRQYNAVHIAVATSNTVYVAPDPDNGVEEVIPCGGCQDGVTLVLNQINLYGKGGDEDVINRPDNTSPPVENFNGQCITYNGGAGEGVCGATPTRNTTWGQVKSLYR